MSTLYFPLNDGTTIPALGFGTGTALMKQGAVNATKIAVKTGFVHFDTAPMYGTEDQLGAVLDDRSIPRDKLYVTTKFLELKGGETVKSALQESLRKLKLEYVDLFLIHAPLHFAGRLKEVWAEMEEVKKEGLARSIGVSNFGIEDFEEFWSEATIKPAVNQIEFHPYVLGQFEPLLEYSHTYGIRLESYGALAPITREPGGPLDPILSKLRTRLAGTWGRPVTDGQILFKWCLQKGIVVVTTSSKEDRMKEYLAVLDMPDLTPEEVTEIDVAGKKKGSGPAESIGRYKNYVRSRETHA
ncbi:Aldo/keto reductase [Neolentinus lepideus HHB14362 ss-1]|uniref:Aldo/keto reductase n=1 Tax=Neolentinus lepideus HHB14362 ss-1 TaxID=1314782 RepID=A0A165VUT4_9AGAM|nr:Aldo/keto reductase [Neolentinus lepideus HHB14362 ss-1]